MLNKKHRLNLRFHRDYLHSQGVVKHSPLFTVVHTPQHILEQETAPHFSRFSVLLSKKLTKKAATRNKLKRRLHEIIRTNLDSLPSKRDILIIPKKQTLRKTYSELETSLLQIIKQIKLK